MFSLSKYGMKISVKLNEELVLREELKRFEIVADIDFVSDFLKKVILFPRPRKIIQ